MAGTVRKYNPGFLTDEELVASFCVRVHEYESIVEMLRECTGSSNPHQIVIGPRGSGKTSLLLRIAAEVRRDAELSRDFFPVVFAEESYEVASAGEFWLECLSRLADQAPTREGGPDLRRSFEDLRTIRDDRTLGDRCLGTLMDYSAREGKRLVLMVENLNMMFRDMMESGDAGWRLRKVLQTEPRIVLLASATSRFDEIDHPEHALYDQLRVVTLDPLDTNECSVLWEKVAGRCPRPETVRSLEILTGGSPRLLAIVARFGAGRSFRELMADLLDLVDDHTEYFKSHIESLPAQERRVYLALADLWKPATTKEIADRTRLDTNRCSAQLTRLVDRGVVRVAGGSARRKQYYLTERLYNIYYLMRRSRGPDSLIAAIIQFMEAYYSPRELRDIGVRLTREDDLDPELESLRHRTLAGLMARPALAGYREEILAAMSGRFVAVLAPGSILSKLERAPATGVRDDRHRPERVDGSANESAELVAARALFEEGYELEARNRSDDALRVFDEAIRRYGERDVPELLDLVARALVRKGDVLSGGARIKGEGDESIVIGEAVRRFMVSDVRTFHDGYRSALVDSETALDRAPEALATYDEVVRRFGESNSTAVLESIAMALVGKGKLLVALSRDVDALAAFDEVISRFGDSDETTILGSAAKALVGKGITLVALNRNEDALAAVDEVVLRFGDSDETTILESVALALVGKGMMLVALSRNEDALAAFDEVILRFAGSDATALLVPAAAAFFGKAVVLVALGRRDEALIALDDVARRTGESETPFVLHLSAAALFCKGATLGDWNRPEEALVAYDEALCRLKECGTPIFPELAAMILVNRGGALALLNRYEEALAANEDAIRRFGESENSILSEPVARALLNKGAALHRLGRYEEAIAAYDLMVCRFGTSDASSLRQMVAAAVFWKGTMLDALNRSEEAMAVCEEVVDRFGASDAPAFSEWTAKALLKKGDILRKLNRLDDALDAFDYVAQRFGTSDVPALLAPVATAFIGEGIVLHGMNRLEEAVAAFDKAVRWLRESDMQPCAELAASAYAFKGRSLAALNRPEEALAAHNAAARRFKALEHPALGALAEQSSLEKAEIEHRYGRHETAIETAGRAIEQLATESSEARLRGHLIRVRAVLASGDPSRGEPDIEAILAILPELGALPKDVLHALMAFSTAIGPERMSACIRTSPSASLLLPLTTALERELGLEPRVAREVEEIAQDIRRDLAKLKEPRGDRTT